MTNLFIYRTATNCRYFSSTAAWNLPKPNDQKDLIDKIDSLEEKFNDIDRDLEELVEEITEDDEENYVPPASDSGDDSGSEGGLREESEVTELTKYMSDRKDEKDDLVGENMEQMDRALFDENNRRKEKSLLLDMISESTAGDIETLKSIQSQLDPDDPSYEKASEILERLEAQGEEVADLQEKWHENDLPPIRESQSQSTSDASASTQENKSFPQDSSDVHQTDFNSFEPFED